MTRVILIDCKELAQLMIEHEVGVSVAHRYEPKRLDLDYFVIDENDIPDAHGNAAERGTGPRDA